MVIDFSVEIQIVLRWIKATFKCYMVFRL